MSNYPCETSEETLALDWAAELTLAFSRVLNKPCPFAVEPEISNAGLPHLRVAGCLVGWSSRRELPLTIARMVASERAGYEWPYDRRWHENASEVAGLVASMRDEMDADEFAAWVTEFRGDPESWTVEYLEWADNGGAA